MRSNAAGWVNVKGGRLSEEETAWWATQTRTVGLPAMDDGAALEALSPVFSQSVCERRRTLSISQCRLVPSHCARREDAEKAPLLLRTRRAHRVVLRLQVHRLRDIRARPCAGLSTERPEWHCTVDEARWDSRCPVLPRWPPPSRSDFNGGSPCRPWTDRCTTSGSEIPEGGAVLQPDGRCTASATHPTSSRPPRIILPPALAARRMMAVAERRDFRDAISIVDKCLAPTAPLRRRDARPRRRLVVAGWEGDLRDRHAVAVPGGRPRRACVAPALAALCTSTSPLALPARGTPPFPPSSLPAARACSALCLTPPQVLIHAADGTPPEIPPVRARARRQVFRVAYGAPAPSRQLDLRVRLRTSTWQRG